VGLLACVLSVILGVVTSVVSDAVKERKLDPWQLFRPLHKADRLTDGDLLWAVREAFRRSVRVIGHEYLRPGLKRETRQLVEQRIQWLEGDAAKLIPSSLENIEALSEPELKGLIYPGGTAVQGALRDRLMSYLEGMPDDLQEAIIQELPHKLAFAFGTVLREEGRGERANKALTRLLVEDLHIQIEDLAQRLEGEWQLYRVPGIDRAVLQHYTSTFVGRDEVLAQIDTFLSNRTSGYLLISAEAGQGKTALAVYLAAQRGYLLHLIGSPWAGEPRPGDLPRNTPQEIARNLGQQLIERYGFERVRLHGNAHELCDAFRNLLRRLSERPLPSRGYPLVIMLDGLDEACESEGVGVWNLMPRPSELPSFVFFILLGRPTTDWSEAPAPSPTVPLSPLDAAAVRQMLTSAGDPTPRSDDFILQVQVISGGSPLYLRHLVEDIVAWGEDAGPRLSLLPRRVDEYYGLQFERLDREIKKARYEQKAFDIIWLLAFAYEPLSRGQIIRITGMRSMVFDRAIEPIRRFTVGTERHSLIHPVFRKVARKQFEDRLVAEERTQFFDRLLTYCRRWPEHATEEDQGYALRHYASHLAEAEQREELHQLVACGPGDRQTWAEARYAMDGSYAGYLGDLHLAWSHADAGGPPPATAVGRQVRYALIESSIHGLACNFPAELLVALVVHQVPGWSPAAALDTVSLISDEREHATALALLVPELPSELMPQALATALAIENEWRRVETMVALAPHLPSELLLQALTAVQAIGDEWMREKALGTLAPYLPSELMPQALITALAISDELSRAGALAHLAPHLLPDLLPQALDLCEAISAEAPREIALAALAPHLPPELLARALGIGRGIQDPMHRAKVLAILIPLLPIDVSADVLTQAWCSAQAIRDPQRRADALTTLVPLVPSVRKEQLLAEALAAAQEIWYGPVRGDALAVLAQYLPRERRDGVLTEAISSAKGAREGDWDRADSLITMMQSTPVEWHAKILVEALPAALEIDDEATRGLALVALAPYLPPNLIADVLAGIRTINDDKARAGALVGVAPYLPAGLLGPALKAAQSIRVSTWRADVLVALTPLLPIYLISEVQSLESMLPTRERCRLQAAIAMRFPNGHQTEFLLAATNNSIDDRVACTRALAALAPHLPSDVLGQVLRAVPDIWNEEERTEVLASLVPHLSPELLREALMIVLTIDNRSWRVRAVGILAVHLSDELLSQALAVVLRFNDVMDYPEVIANLAPYLPAHEREALVVRAFSMAQAIEDDFESAERMTMLVPVLPIEAHREVLARVLSCRSWLSTVFYRQLTGLLSSMAPYLAPDLQAQILVATQAVPGPGKAEVLAALAPHLPSGLLDNALASAQAIEDSEWRARALAVLIPYLPPTQQQETLAEILNILGPLLGGKLQEESVLFRLSDGGVVYDEETLALVLGSLASYLPRELLPLGLATAQAIADRGLRARVLAALASRLSAENRTRVLGEALVAACSIEDDRLRQKALAAVSQSWAGSVLLTRNTGHALWLDLLHALADKSRAAFLGDLTALTPMIEVLGGCEAAEDTIHAIVDVTRWWP
jgi:hypothetical protein